MRPIFCAGSLIYTLILYTTLTHLTSNTSPPLQVTSVTGSSISNSPPFASSYNGAGFVSSADNRSTPFNRKLLTGAFTSQSCCVRSIREGIVGVSGSNSDIEFFRIVSSLPRSALQTKCALGNLGSCFLSRSVTGDFMESLF